MQEDKWYLLDGEDVLNKLDSNELGLSAQEIKKRQNKYGLNILNFSADKMKDRLKKLQFSLIFAKICLGDLKWNYQKLKFMMNLIKYYIK